MQTKKHIKLVLIGRSGAGKSTFVNSLVNHFYTLDYDEERIIAIKMVQKLYSPTLNQTVSISLDSNISEFRSKQSDLGGNQSTSQTTKANIYDLENEEYKLSLIDTPGLCDTAGTEADQGHYKNICAAVSALSDFNCIVLVHKASDCRKDPIMSYLVGELRAMLPKGIERNFMVCFTNCVNPSKIDALDTLKEMNIPITQSNFFCFENDSLTPPVELLKVAGIELDSKGCLKNAEDRQRASEVMTHPKLFWNNNRSQFKVMVERVMKTDLRSGEDMVEIQNQKSMQTKLVKRYADKFIEKQEETMRLQANHRKIVNLQREIQENKDYVHSGIRQVKKVRKVKATRFEDQELPEGTKITQCLDCKHLCHNPCQLDGVYQKGNLELKLCDAFQSNDRCRRTECKHSYAVHTHTTVIRKEVEYEVEEFYFEAQSFDVKDYDKESLVEAARLQEEEIQSAIRELEPKLKTLESEMNSVYRLVAYTHQMLSNSAICAENEHFLEYLECRKEIIEKNHEKTAEQKRLEKDQIDKAKQEYLLVKEAVRTQKGFVGLSTQEDAMFQSEYNLIQEQQAKVVASYKIDRQVHNKQVLKRKNTVSLESGCELI